MERTYEFRDLGGMEYLPALELQKAAVASVKAGNPDVLFIVEHPPTYTLGRKGQRLALETDAAVTLVPVERGGEATFHSPGQLVAYPILKLTGEEQDIHKYLRNLEAVLIRQLAGYGLKGESRQDATGVWLVGEEKKIASIGVAVTSWVTYHGIALNVHNDLTGFHRITPCGFSPSVMTSLAEQLGSACPTLAKAKEDFIGAFEYIFGRTRSRMRSYENEISVPPVHLD